MSVIFLYFLSIWTPAFATDCQGCKVVKIQLATEIEKLGNFSELLKTSKMRPHKANGMSGTLLEGVLDSSPLKQVFRWQTNDFVVKSNGQSLDSPGKFITFLNEVRKKKKPLYDVWVFRDGAMTQYLYSFK